MQIMTRSGRNGRVKTMGGGAKGGEDQGREAQWGILGDQGG